MFKINTLISKLLNRVRLIGKWKHLFRIKKAKQVQKTLFQIKNQNDEYYRKIFGYLRKINPFVFEELVLSVIEKQNIRIIRNKSYSNDGGIDGKFVFNGKVFIVQCKRYQSYINNKDVEKLFNDIKIHKADFGVFVHTGKTGEKSKNMFKIEEKIILVSGQNMIDLIMETKNISDFLIRKI